MRYIIVGADRETGEEVEFRVEARSDAEASQMANRRGILVASCLVEGVEALSAVNGVQGWTKRLRPIQHLVARILDHPAIRTRRKLIIAAASLLALVLVPAFVAAYQTYTAAFVAEQQAREKSAAADQRIAEQTQRELDASIKMNQEVANDIAQRRAASGYDMIGKNNYGSSGTASSNEATKAEAIANDARVTAFVEQNPDMLYLIKSDSHRLDLRLTEMVALGLVTLSDANYLVAFSQKISVLPD